MKILFCANIYESGTVGPARLAEMLLKINDLYAGVHELRILTADVEKAHKFVYPMEVHYPKYLRVFDVWFRGRKFHQSIIRIKREYDFDVVIFGNAIYAAYTKILNKKWCIGGFVNDYNTATIGLKKVFAARKGWGVLFHKIIEKWCVRHLNFTIVCSDFLKQKLIEAYQPQNNKLFKLYQSVNVADILFFPRHFDPSKQIKVLFVKTSLEIGGLEDVAKAFFILKQYDFELTIAGPEFQHSKKINSFFENMPNIKVRFLGPVSHRQVLKLMGSHHILTMPSLIEGQGLANVEGMASGISVVSSQAGGIPEVLDNGNNGWLCEPGNPDSLATALRDCIMADKEKRMAKLISARKYAEAHFDFPVMLEKFLNLLSVFINKRSDAE